MSDGLLRGLARVAFVVTTALLLGGLAAASYMASRGAVTWREVLPDFGFAIAMYTFSLVGFVIARRQPRNSVAWILLGVSFSWLIDLPAAAYLAWETSQPGGTTTGPYLEALFSASWVPGIAPLGTFLLLLFPDGRLPTPKWRWWAWLCAGSTTLAFLAILFMPGPIDGVVPVTTNPFGVAALEPIIALLYAPIMLIPVCIVGCAVALVRRYRRSRGIERLQLKWLTATAGLVAAIFLAAMVVSIPYNWSDDVAVPLYVSVLQNGSLFGFMLIPVAVGIAVLRYRLYDIDRLINRALVYGAVSAVLVAVYVLGVVGTGSVLRAVTGQEQGNLAVAGSTLAVAALFRPFRARVQRFIDRRFYRRKYDAARTVEAFSTSLRQETDLQMLTDGLRQVVSDTVQPVRMTLWIPTQK